MRNVMRMLAMLGGELEGEPSAHYWRSDWNEDVAVKVTESGFYVPEAELFAWVEAGDVLGRVFDVTGEIIEEVRAPSAGYVGMRKLLPRALPGDFAAMLAVDYEG